MSVAASDATLTPGFCDRNNAANAFLVLSSLTLFVATCTVPLRMYVRLCVVKAFWWDDACLISAYLCLLPYLGILWQTVTLGLGRHIGCYTIEDAVFEAELQYIAQILAIISTIFARTSVALFVIRLFAVTRKLRRVLYVYTTFMAVSLAVTAFLILGLCRPVQAVWDFRIQDAQCWSPAVLSFINYYNGAVAILSDFLLALLPTYFLHQLQMGTRQKFAIACLMALGLIPGICAICRTATATDQLSSDPLYKQATLFVFGALEASMLVITATIPALAALFRKRGTKSPRENSYDASPSQASSKLPRNQALDGIQIESTFSVAVTDDPADLYRAYRDPGVELPLVRP